MALMLDFCTDQVLSLHVTTAKALPAGWTTLLLFGVNVAMAAASHRWLEPQGSRVVKAAWQRLAHPLTS